MRQLVDSDATWGRDRALAHPAARFSASGELQARCMGLGARQGYGDVTANEPGASTHGNNMQFTRRATGGMQISGCETGAEVLLVSGTCPKVLQVGDSNVQLSGSTVDDTSRLTNHTQCHFCQFGGKEARIAISSPGRGQKSTQKTIIIISCILTG